MDTSTLRPTAYIAARVILKPRKALPFYGRHPWVLASAIDRVEPVGIHSEHQLAIDGQVVELLNDKRKFIAHGVYNSKSRIAVRLYSWNAEEQLDEAFLRRRLEAAIELRRQISYEPATGGSGRSDSATRLAEDLSQDAIWITRLRLDLFVAQGRG